MSAHTDAITAEIHADHWLHRSKHVHGVTPGVNDAPTTVGVASVSTGPGRIARVVLAILATAGTVAITALIAGSIIRALEMPGGMSVRWVLGPVSVLVFLYLRRLFTDFGTTLYRVPAHRRDAHDEQILAWFEAYPEEFPMYAYRPAGSRRAVLVDADR